MGIDSILQNVADTAHSVAATAQSVSATVSDYLTSTSNVVGVLYHDVLPLVRPIFESFQERRLSLFFRALRGNLLTRLKHADLMSPRLPTFFLGDVPFTHFEQEPEQVSQFKKVLNAMYHAEKCFELIEQHPPILSTSSLTSLYLLYTNISDHAHELIHIASNIDVNLTGYFSGELAQLDTLIGLCRQCAGPQVARFQNGSMWANMQHTAHAVGHYAGVATDQLQPHSGQTDFHFLTTFGGVLSGHLSTLTAQIRSYASSSATSPSLTKERLAALNQTADALYQKMTQVQASGVSDPMSFAAIFKHPLIYKDILGHITELSTSIFKQMQQANEAAQVAIQDQLSELKNKHLLDLFCLIDKIELFGAFKPGALSKPLLMYLKTWYELLLTLAQSIVDLKHKRPDLLVIEDSRFAHARMAEMLGRLAKFTTKELELVNVPDAMETFFTAVERCIQHTTLMDELLDKDNLLRCYQFFRPFMVRMNPAFDLRLLRDLGCASALSVTTEPRVTLDECMRVREDMEKALRKAMASQQFYRSLAEDMIQGIFSRVDTLVVPYVFPGVTAHPLPTSLSLTAGSSNVVKSLDSAVKPRNVGFVEWPEQLRPGNNPFRINELQWLGLTEDQARTPSSDHVGIHTLIQDNLTNNSEYAPCLYEGYQIYLHQLAWAQKACEAFQKQLRDKDWALHQPELQNLYLAIQPYLMHLPLRGSSTEHHRKELDQSIIACLDSKQTADSDSTIRIAQEFIRLVLLALNESILFAQDRGALFMPPTKAFLSRQTEASAYVFDSVASQRVHHVFSHERYSASVHQLSEAFRDTLRLFSPPIQQALATAQQGSTPFPDIEDEVKALQTPDQVLLLKQLMNALYYLEDLFKQMEQLDDRNGDIKNAFYLIMATKQAIQLITLINTIRTHPNLAIFMHDVLQRIEHMQNIWLGLRPLYTISSTTVGDPAEVALSNGTWYSMLGLMVLPEHLKALQKGRGFSAADAQSYQALAKDTTLKIAHILDHTDTYFRMFLASPDMIKVFTRVKETLSQFSGQTYESVMTHLKSLRDVTFPALLVDVDEWEQRLALVPGTLSGPLKTMLDAFYLGLIEPLNLPSEDHLALATSLASFTVRERALRSRIVWAKAQCYRLAPYIKTLTEWVTAIESFKEGDDRVLFCERLERALPLLLEHQHRFSLGITRRHQDDRIDELCHELKPNETRQLRHIKFLAIRCLALYEGTRDTWQFQESLMGELLSGLSVVKSAQMAANLAYKTHWITQLLDRQIDGFVTEQKDMWSIRESYCSTLKQHLLQHKPSILSALSQRAQTDHVSEEIERLLQSPLQEFAVKEYPHFMKLESIVVALKAFECYLNQEGIKRDNHAFLWFESAETLQSKRTHVNAMKTIAMDANKPAEARWKAIHAMLTDSKTQDTLMAYHHYDLLSWDGLKQLFWQLLQAVGLYTPGYQAAYAHLNGAAMPDKEPDSAQFLKSYGLFNTKRTYALPPASQVDLSAALSI